MFEAKWRSLLNNCEEHLHVMLDPIQQQAVSIILEGDGKVASYQVLSNNWIPYRFKTFTENATLDFSWKAAVSPYSSVDYQATPFTNTLAIRSLNLRVGENSSLDVLYIEYPIVAISKAFQVYERLGLNKYKFYQPEDDFEVEFYVDDNGLVKDYPGWFERIA